MVGRKMTANELADLLETTESTNNKAAAMLRQFGLAESIIKQQQLEIEALKKEKDELQIECDRLYRIIELKGRG